MNWTPLHHAVQEGHGQIVKMLLNLGADVNAVTSVRYTTHA